MGIEALTHREDGTRVDVPRSREDWQQWVSPGRTRNWMLNDPLLDWLDWHGKDKGYIPAQSGPDYRAELDFLPFIFEQGRKFEEGILRLLHAQHEVTVIAQDPHDIRDLAKAEETFAAMRSGDPIIHQAVLWDAEHMTYGAPDFLIRSDVLLELFPPACSDERRKLFPTDIISEDEARIPAPALGDVQWHYRVVDVKFTTLHLNAGANQLDNGGSNPAYKAQLYLYNRMLGRLQGHQPPNSYLLGRGWEFERKKVDHRGSNALDRLGHISQDGAVARGISIKDKVEEALAWIRRMRTEGHSWSLTDVPLRSELYPNMSASGDDMLVDRNRPEADRDAGEVAQDWGSVKKWLAEQIKELTQLWQVSVDGRKQAHGKGIYGWDDPRISPEDVLTRGVNGYGPRLARMLRVNAADGPQILPECVEQDRDVWHPTPSLEFYVDFEFCMDLNDDFSRLPERGGQTLIFMIGCGHVEDGDWKFEKWITDRLTEDEELRIIRGWVDHMRKCKLALTRSTRDPAYSTGRTPRRRSWRIPTTPRESAETANRPIGRATSTSMTS